MSARTGPSSLIEEHLSFVLGLARQHRRTPGIQTDDLESVAAETLLRASSRFDPSRAASFRNYVARRVKGAFLDHVRQWEHAGRQGRHLATQVPFSVLAGDFNPEDRRRAFTEELEIEDLVAHVLRGTTEREKRILWRRFGDGLSLGEIGRELGLSEVRISQIIKRLRVRFGAYDKKLQPRLPVSRETRKRTASRFGVGVRLYPSGRFKSAVWVRRRQIHLGMFDSAEEAQAARRRFLEERGS